MSEKVEEKSIQKNIFGEPLEACCFDPKTGFFRDGFCHTNAQDRGSHTVCVRVDDVFLEYSKQVGNDLSTPRSEWGFPGLQSGDGWCLCAARWQEAFDAGKAPHVYLRRTHEKCLDHVSLSNLKSMALDLC